MSVQRARQVLKKQHTDLPVLFDLPNHRNFLKYLTGKDCFYDMENVVSEAIHKLDVDILNCSVPYTPKNPEVLEKDPNLYTTDPTVWRNHDSTDIDVLNHDPLKLRPFWDVSDDELKTLFIQEDARNRFYAGGTAMTLGFLFTTCFHYAAEDLSYEDFLCTCMTAEQDELDRLFDRYEHLSHRILQAWNACNIELMFCHDDIANSNSLAISPDFLRKNLFPRYKRLYANIKQKGIPLLAVTDGNFIEVARDYLEVGADGFFVDRPAMSLEKLIALCGEDKFYFTGPTPEIMTVGTPESVQKEMDMLMEISKDVPGLMFHMPGGWPHNVPVENVKTYYKRLGRL